MAMRQVAQLADVSISTVSRVLSHHPSIAAETVRNVHRAMAQLNFIPPARRIMRRDVVTDTQSAVLGMLVFGASGGQVAPAFQNLLRGVSDAASQFGAELAFSFVRDPEELPQRVVEGRIDGLLLHGTRPSAHIQKQLSHLPTVWLMANRQRPLWGDQVMPNNPAIGEMAVRYLTRRGHKNLACLKAVNDGWSLRLRAWAFAQAGIDAGVEVDVIEAADLSDDNIWSAQGLSETADYLVGQLLSRPTMPTGIFVLEDRLLPPIHEALLSRGVSTGPKGDLEILSCNNERPQLAGLHDLPATVDIRADRIGRRGVEQLLWRIRHPETGGRMSFLVEPNLVEPASEIGPSQ